MPSENLLSPAYYNMNVRILQTLVGADSAPTVGTLRIFIYYKPLRRRVCYKKS